MPSPSTTLTTLRPDLGGSFIEYPLDALNQGYIATEVLPVFEASKQSGTFGIIPTEQLLKLPQVTRTSQGGYGRGSFTFTEGTYATQEYGYEEVVDNRNSALYSSFFDAEMLAALRARHIIMKRAEKRVADAVFNSSTWTGGALTTAITNEWDDYNNATPISDVEAAVRKVWTLTGIWADTLIINRTVFRNLRLCDEIRDAITSAGAGSPAKATDVSIDMLKTVFDLPKILVAGGIYDSGVEGQATTFSNVWSDEYAMVCKTANTNDIQEPCIGRTIHWAEDGSEIGGTVESYEEAQVRGTIIRVRHDVQEKILYSSCGHLLSNITT